MKDIKMTELEHRVLLLELRLKGMNDNMQKLIEALSNRTKNVDKVLGILFDDYEARENERIDKIFERVAKIQKYLM